MAVDTAPALNGAGSHHPEPPEAPKGLPIGNVQDILANAPDLVEDVIEMPQWGCSLKIRSLTAAEQAKIKQAAFKLSGGDTAVTWAAMEKLTFEYGVVEPKFTAPDVNALYHKSGPGFARVLSELNRISGISKEDLEQAKAAFQAAEDR